MVEHCLHANAHEHTLYPTVNLAILNGDNPVITPITTNEIQIAIRQFKHKKSPVISLISKKIMCQLPTSMMFIYRNIMNASLSTGLFHDRFKHAILKFILKGNKPRNHRPISLLEEAGKVYEKIINVRFCDFLIRKNKTNKRQHNYCQQHDIHTTLALMDEEIDVSQRNREQCHVVLHDLTKVLVRFISKA